MPHEVRPAGRDLGLPRRPGRRFWGSRAARLPHRGAAPGVRDGGPLPALSRARHGPRRARPGARTARGTTRGRLAVRGRHRHARRPPSRASAPGTWPDVLSVRPLGGFRLRLRFEDGTEGDVDIAAIVGKSTGVFAPLRKIAYFESVRVDRGLGTICWPN